MRDISWLKTGRGGVLEYLKISLAEGTIENEVKVSITAESLIKLLPCDF